MGAGFFCMETRFLLRYSVQKFKYRTASGGLASLGSFKAKGSVSAGLIEYTYPRENLIASSSRV